MDLVNDINEAISMGFKQAMAHFWVQKRKRDWDMCVYECSMSEESQKRKYQFFFVLVCRCWSLCLAHVTMERMSVWVRSGANCKCRFTFSFIIKFLAYALSLWIGDDAIRQTEHSVSTSIAIRKTNELEFNSKIHQYCWFRLSYETI